MIAWENILQRWRRAVAAFNYEEPEPLRPRSPTYTRHTVHLDFDCDAGDFTVELAWDEPNGFDFSEGPAFGVVRRLPTFEEPTPDADKTGRDAP